MNIIKHLMKPPCFMPAAAQLGHDKDGSLHVEVPFTHFVKQNQRTFPACSAPAAAQLDHDKDGFLHVEELSRALADCNISIESDTLERLIEREVREPASVSLLCASLMVGVGGCGFGQGGKGKWVWSRRPSNLTPWSSSHSGRCYCLCLCLCLLLCVCTHTRMHVCVCARLFLYLCMSGAMVVRVYANPSMLP